ncbi:MAG: protein kinase [Gemmatimonadota bacterium]|nr:protein kinase [Gemmatimonadota bacterium]
MTQDSFDKIEELLRKETVGQYRIQHLLGKGGMAVVYLAQEVHLSRNVAIKVLPPELTFGHGVERFKREAKTAAALDHPNIIPIYRVSTEGTLFWYAMKYLEGQSLEQVLKDRGKLPLALTIKILRQVAEALDYAHEHQVVHRDMKPANVMLDSRNRVIVTDFGIAKALSEGTLTASGSVIGTPYFMSPEQGMGKMVSGASDQYSVGVMAYRMLAGQVPFEGDSAIDVLHKHCMVQPPALETAAPGLPRNVYLAVHRALDKKGENRFPTVGAMVDAMESADALGSLLDLSVRGTGAGDATLVVSTAELSSPDLATTPMPSLARSIPGMGDDPTTATPPTPQTLPPSASLRIVPNKKRSPVGIIAAVVIVIGGGAAGAYFATRGGTTPAPTQTQPAVTSPVAQTPPASPADTQRVAEPPVTPPQAQQQTPVETPPAAPRTGTLVIQGMPSGGAVTVGGRVQRGSQIELAPGRHQVQLIHPDYATQEATVTIAAGRAATLRFSAQRLQAQAPPPAAVQPPAAETPRQTAPALLESQGILRISVSPVAEILVSGESKGVKNRLVDTLLAGGYLIRMIPTDPNYADTSFAVEVAPGASNPAVVIRLRRR